MLQGAGWPLTRLISGVEYGSLKLINRAVGSLKFEFDPATFGIVVEVGVDVVGIDAMAAAIVGELESADRRQLWR